MNTQAVYPGSFDPVTNGHLDIIRRAARLFSPLTVAVIRNPSKNSVFSLEERVFLLKASLKEAGIPGRIQVDSFEGLLVQYLNRKKINVVVRGLRFVSDFEYEFQMALTNRRLKEDMETVFLTPDEHHSYLSSSLIREVARYGQPLNGFVPSCVAKALRKKYRS